jgi:hypothetical protein
MIATMHWSLLELNDALPGRTQQDPHAPPCLLSFHAAASYQGLQHTYQHSLSHAVIWKQQISRAQGNVQAECCHPNRAIQTRISQKKVRELFCWTEPSPFLQIFGDVHNNIPDDRTLALILCSLGTFCDSVGKQQRLEGKRRVRRPATCHPTGQLHKCHGDPAVDRAWLQVPAGIAEREKRRVAGVIVEPVWIGTAAIISNAVRPTGCAYQRV